MKNILNKLAILMLSAFFIVKNVWADEEGLGGLPLKIPIPDGTPEGVTAITPIAGENGNLLIAYFRTIYTYAIAISGSVAVVIILISAVRIITAGEDTGVIASSKERIYNCLIGIALLLFIGYLLNLLNPFAFTF